MSFKPDEGYGFIQSEITPDDKRRVTQIKTEFIKQFNDLFTVEDSGMSVYDKDDVQEELNNVYDFATSFLADVLKSENHKVEILTKEEFAKKFID